MPTAIKICGLTSVDEALAAAHCGIHAIGMVAYPRSPRFIPNDLAGRIAVALPPFVTSVVLMVDPTIDEVERLIEHVRPDLLQFHGDEPPDFCGRFSVPYIKALRVRPETDLLQYARDYSGAKGLLVDAYVEGTHGGTGASFDWNLIPRELPLPVILAGGLNPQNVTEAIKCVRPWAVDVSSGVEVAKGKKDAALIAAFVRGVKDADV